MQKENLVCPEGTLAASEILYHLIYNSLVAFFKIWYAEAYWPHCISSYDDSISEKWHEEASIAPLGSVDDRVFGLTAFWPVRSLTRPPLSPWLSALAPGWKEGTADTPCSDKNWNPTKAPLTTEFDSLVSGTYPTFKNRFQLLLPIILNKWI